MAPDFNLKVMHKQTRVALSSFRNQRPVALIFGSYTWPPFRAQVGALNAMAEKYRGKVEFLLVYIREAHPTDGRQVRANLRDGIRISAAKDLGQKEEVATWCVRNLGIKFTAIVDNMDAKVEMDYMGWPDRMYVVGKSGRIAWKGDPGPQGFKPPQLEAAIQKELQQ
jgi:Iodothyronine deiodinase